MGCSPAAKDRIADDSWTRISMMANLHTAQVPAETIELLLEEKTNTRLDIQWIPDGSYDAKMYASLATGTLPKALYLKNAASFSSMISEIRSGLFWEIGPYLDSFPNLSLLKQEVLDNIRVDGKLYALYQERALARQGVIYRKDWADKLGLGPPETLEDLYMMLKKFTLEDPDGNGRNDTIGLTDRSDLIYGAFKSIASYHGVPNEWGFVEDVGTIKLKPEFMFQEFKDTLDFFRRLHEEGLINKDFPVTSKADQQELLIQGKAGVYIGAMGDVVSLEARLQEVNPDASLDVHNRVNGPKGPKIWASSGYGTVVLFPKSAISTEEELLKILEFYDQLMSPEAANLIYWGLEDTHYKVVDGKAATLGTHNQKDKDVKPYQALMVGGFSTIPNMLVPYYNLEVKEKAERLIVDNEQFLVYDPTVSLTSETFNIKGNRIMESIHSAVYKYILGMIDEEGFDRAVEVWLKEGGQQIIHEFNASYLKKQAH
nr:extracellular solute-binding protein [Paenibacillus lemnae]